MGLRWERASASGAVGADGEQSEGGVVCVAHTLLKPDMLETLKAQDYRDNQWLVV